MKKKKIKPAVVRLGGKPGKAVDTFVVPAIFDKVRVGTEPIDFSTAFEPSVSPVIEADTVNTNQKRDVAPTSGSLFGMKIHSKSQTVTRRDALNIDRTCAITNPEQWDLFLLAVKHNGTLSKAQVRTLLPLKEERNNTAARLRARLQEIQLTFCAEGRYYVLKENPE